MKQRLMRIIKFQELEVKLLDFKAAEAYKKLVAKAEGEASRFVSIYDEYKNAKAVTRENVLRNGKVLADIEKVIIKKMQDLV